jgi:hypothetical protein
VARSGTLELGDLVSHRDRRDELLIVIGHTYRVSRWGNRRLMKVFCSSTGKQEYVLEDQLVIVKKSEKSS